MRLNLSEIPGHYECYWHFYHNGRRFGHWLGCQVIVDPSPVKPEDFSFLEPASKTFLYRQSKKLKMETPENIEKETETFVYKDHAYFINEEEAKTLNNEEDLQDVSASMEKLTINIPADDTNCSSDSDNQSIISIADSNTSASSGSSEDFVLVPHTQPTDEAVKLEEAEEMIDGIAVQEEAPGNDDNNNNPEEVNVENSQENLPKANASVTLSEITQPAELDPIQQTGNWECF